MGPLSEDMIIDCIKEYINNVHSRYAILIDGEWGSGKTFFLKEKLITFLKKNELDKQTNDPNYKRKKVIYISLYGISSTDEIAKQIWLEFLPLKEGIGKLSKISELSKVVISGGLSFFNITLPDIDYEKMVDMDKCILCFDDLERCNMNINEILGYINFFVEHDCVKTIIVANQKEIGRLNYSSDLELKFPLALNESIGFPDKEKSRNNYAEKNTQNESVDFNKLMERTEYLFGKNILFNQIKEKLIGVTIQFEPNIDKMMEPLIGKYISDPDLKEAIMSSKDFIIDKIRKYNHLNIRTVLFAIEKYYWLGIIIKKFNFKPGFQKKVLDDIFKYCFVLSIIIKQGKETPFWNDGNHYGSVNLEPGKLWSFDNIFGFRFIDNYLIYSELNEVYITNVIQQYYHEVENNEHILSDPINKLSNWHELEDTQLLDYVEQVKDNLATNKYDPSFYPTIIARFIEISKLGFEVDINKIILIMKSNIDSLTTVEKINFNMFGASISKDIHEEYNKVIEQMESYIHKKLLKSTTLDVNTYITHSENWSIALLEYINRNKDRFIQKRTFFALIEVDKLLDTIKMSSNIELQIFRKSIHNIYNFDNLDEFYRSDKENLLLFKKKLEEYFETPVLGKIKTQIIQWLVQQINGYIQKLG